MYWYELWYELYYGNEVSELNKYQMQALDMLKIKVDIYQRKKLMQKHSLHKHNRTTLASLTQYKNLLDCIEYYELHYVLGVEPPYNYYTSKFKPKSLTKNEQYIRRQSRISIAEYWQSYSAAHQDVSTRNDDEFIATLFDTLPLTVFSLDQIIIWQHILKFAQTEMCDFKLAKKNNHRISSKISMTYMDFYNYYNSKADEYSSNDRFFIPHFAKYCEKNQIECTAKQADDLIRYYSDRELFSRKDIDMIIGQRYSEDEFFETLDNIKKLSKKK